MKILAIVNILSILPFISALPAPDTQEAARFVYPWLNMTLNNLESICRPKSGSLYSCTIKFDFSDPNTEGVADVNGAPCEASWEWDGINPDHGPRNNFPKDYTVCCGGSIPEAFQFKVEEFRSASRFELFVSHWYKDTRFFRPPYQGRKAVVNIKIPDEHPAPPRAPYVPPVDQFEWIATATVSRRTDGLS
ncbi:hypothetical protein CCHL11_10274 [Colletotrichum chlorophyti]|uniref:Uncharacterized protein n=1 Tax=Colletotrichum chlorophyti TaxID=708187 RepID=A0A1Q8RQA2_9PEZI|nr:hypothetical protein CCHL11_10274 [Colletotrichum chlorophyti]